MGELVTGVGPLRFGRLQRALCTAPGGLGLFVFAAAGIALWQQQCLAVKIGGNLPQPRLFCRQYRLGASQVASLRLGIETRQQLAGTHPLADFDVALDELAADPERQFGLHLGLNRAGKGDLGREPSRLHPLHLDPSQWRQVVVATATGGQQGCRQCPAQPMQRHAAHARNVQSFGRLDCNPLRRQWATSSLCWL
ncbi:hypothetical protein FQZ97_770870 [compost metagenome]